MLRIKFRDANDKIILERFILDFCSSVVHSIKRSLSAGLNDLLCNFRRPCQFSAAHLIHGWHVKSQILTRAIIWMWCEKMFLSSHSVRLILIQLSYYHDFFLSTLPLPFRLVRKSTIFKFPTMNVKRNCQVMEEFMPFLHILKAFDASNFRRKEWSDLLPSILHTLRVTTLLVTMVLQMALGYWFCVDYNYGMEEVSRAFPINLCILQTILSGSSLALQHTKMEQTLDRLLTIVGRCK